EGLIECGSGPLSPQNPQPFRIGPGASRLGRARRRPREAPLSTPEARPQAASRLSRADGDQRRPSRAGTAPRQRAEAPVGVIAGTLALAVTAIGRLKSRAEFLHVRGGKRDAAPSLILQARQRQVGGSPSQQR